ncbi:MAG: YfhO family protein [Acidobacteria bacterium]|nr:YfhO family protein [Acidobacteriota bacterium]
MLRPYSLRPKITPDAAAALAVSLLPLVYFFNATRGALFLAPDDGVIFNVPLRVAAANLIRQGFWPLWNPYIFCGMPLHGAAQAGILFPLNWFYLAFNPAAATNLMMLSTYALAALGAYLYARRSGASIAGSITTSLVWQWSGFLVAQIGHTNILHTAALLPWLLWAVDGYGMSGARGRGLVLAAVVALQTFAGHQQTLAYALIVAAVYAVSMARETKSARASYLRSLAFIAAGLALAAVQILPTVELLRNSMRADASYDFFTSFSMPPRFLWTFFAPYVVGGGDGQLFRAPYTGPAFYAEYIAYAGVGTAALAALAFVLRRDARTKFWTIVALAGAALALGRFWPFDLYQLIYHVPVLNLFRVPARHLLEVDFALAVLAGRGVTVIARARNRAKTLRWVLLVGACVFLLTCMAVTVGRPAEFRLGREAPLTLLRAPELFLPIVVAALSMWALWVFARRMRGGALVLLLAVVALDLALWGQSSGWRVASPARESELWREPPSVRALREMRGGDNAPYRILTVPGGFEPDKTVATAATAKSSKFMLALQPDIYMMHGIQNAAGYDGFGLRRYSRLAGDMKVWGDLEDPARSLHGESRELDLLNVRYVLTMQPSTGESAALSSSIPSISTLPATQTFGGYLFAEENLNVPSLQQGERLSFNAQRVEADHLALLTSLSWSAEVPDGAVVGRVRLRAEDGRAFEFELRAGAHTSEWAYDRADIRRRIRHKRAPVATSYSVEDAQGNYEAHTYVASFALPGKAIIAGGEIEVAAPAQAPKLELSVLRASLVDAGGGKTVPLSRAWIRKESAPAPEQTPTDALGEAGGARWRRVGEAGGVLIYENTHALPRAWLATDALVATEQATLEVIRTGKLPDGRQWEPRRTALVESPLAVSLAAEGATAAAVAASPPSRAEITRYEPNRIEVKTAAVAPSILVLAENHYPGWRAYLDNRAVGILRVNYNQRGVLLPPGEHELKFVYHPKSALIGLLVSLLSAVALVLWCWRLVTVEKARRVVLAVARRG